MKKIILESALGAVFILSSCGGSGDDVAQLVPQEILDLTAFLDSL